MSTIFFREESAQKANARVACGRVLAYYAAQMKQIRTIRDLTPDAQNANKGKLRGAKVLEDSLREFGAGRSILIDRNGRVIAGNKVLEQAAAIGLEQVLVIQSDGRKLVAVQRMDLDLAKDSRARLMALADNRAAELDLDWDARVVADQLEGLDGFAKELFTEKEIAAMLDAADPLSPTEGDVKPEREFVCPECGAHFTESQAASRMR